MFVQVLALAVLLLAAPAEVCDGRFGCVEHPPAWYDQHVVVVEAPGDGADTGCIERLRDTHIEHRLLAEVKGVETPIEVRDQTLGGVRYVAADPQRGRLILDCHMVETLASRGRRIRAAGVSTLHWSSSWR